MTLILIKTIQKILMPYVYDAFFYLFNDPSLKYWLRIPRSVSKVDVMMWSELEINYIQKALSHISMYLNVTKM